MVVITSFSQALHDQYAYRVLESFSNWPAEAKLIIYSEDMKGENTDRVEWRDMNFPDLLEFKSRCPPNPPDYTKDAARFSNKVWAMTEGSMNESGLCFWMDADCITYRKIPADFIKRMIPPSYYLGSFERPNYVETGFWGVRANHPEHKRFMTALKDVYLSNELFTLPHWHDCFPLDLTRLRFSQIAKAVNLSKTLNGRGQHPIATSELGRFIDHCKGERKQIGYSPECPKHRELHESGRSFVLGDGERSHYTKVA